VALSISMTAASSILAMITLPLITNFALAMFHGEEGAVRLDFVQVLEIFVIAMVPAMVGAFINQTYPDLARRMDRPVKLLATLFLAAVVVAALIGQWALLAKWGASVFLIAFTFSVTSFSVGYFVPRALRIQ